MTFLKDIMLKFCPLTFKVSEGLDSVTSLASFSSHLIHTFTMLAMLIILLLSSHVLPLDQSLKCNDKNEYKSPDGMQCCKKCEPGESMRKRCEGGQSTQCQSCNTGYFTEEYNDSFGKCNPCTKCTRSHMKYKSNCNLTNDAVCACEEGYNCSGSKCQTCVQTLAHTTVNSPVQLTDNFPEPKPHPDSVWISVSLCFACVCVCLLFTCFLLTSRHSSPCERIMSASAGLWSSKKSNFGSSQCTEEEEVPMPVQEMCGKTEKVEEV